MNFHVILPLGICILHIYICVYGIFVYPTNSQRTKLLKSPQRESSKDHFRFRRGNFPDVDTDEGI